MALDSVTPPIDNTAPPTLPPEDMGALPPSSSITLGPDQLAGAGIDGLKVGDRFTVTISGTVTDDSTGITADVTSASMGEKQTDEPGGNAAGEEEQEGFGSPKGKIELGPPAGMKF